MVRTTQNKQRREERNKTEKQMVVLNEVCKDGGRVTLLLVTGTGQLKLKGARGRSSLTLTAPRDVFYWG